MSYIYKTGRAELQNQIKRYSHFVRGRVLDIGAGDFPRYQHLFTSDAYIKMNLEAGENTSVFGKIEAIPFPDDSFDSIICTQVLGDVYDLNKAFSEMHRVLKSGGVVLITENLFDVLHDEPRDFWRFTAHSLRRLAENAGFKIKILEPRGGYHSVLAQLKARYWIERLNASSTWLAKPLSLFLKICGAWAIYRDKKDTRRANKIFTHGYILICSK